MANHGFFSSKKVLVPEEVYKDLQEINGRRFQGLLTIEKSEWAEHAWFISHPPDSEKGPFNGFNIWIKSKKKMEHRHTHGWSFYLEMVFSNELCHKYGGKISDEGCSGRWNPKPQNYSTFKQYIRDHYTTPDGKFIEVLYDLDLGTCPKKLLDL